MFYVITWVLAYIKNILIEKIKFIKSNKVLFIHQVPVTRFILCNMKGLWILNINPLTAGAAYIRDFTFISTLSTTF